MYQNINDYQHYKEQTMKPFNFKFPSKEVAVGFIYQDYLDEDTNETVKIYKYDNTVDFHGMGIPTKLVVDSNGNEYTTTPTDGSYHVDILFQDEDSIPEELKPYLISAPEFPKHTWAGL